MKLENCHVAEINVFCPQADENVYLVWFEANPEEQVTGPLFQFDVMLDYDTEDFYVAAYGTVAKFEAGAYDFAPTSGLESLIKRMSETLEIGEDISGKITFFIDALLSDEGNDLDESGIDYRWVDFPNAFLSMNNELGRPENRIHIRVKSNVFGDPVPCNVNDESLEFSKENLGLALAISEFEQSG